MDPGTFDYWLNGELVSGGDEASGGFDYWKAGELEPVIGDGPAGEPPDGTIFPWHLWANSGRTLEAI